MSYGILKTNFKSHLSLRVIAMIKCLSKWGACISNVFPTRSKIWSISSELATYSNTPNSAQSQFQSFPGLQFVLTIPTQQSKPISTWCRSIARCTDPIFPDWLPLPLPCLAMPPLLLGHSGPGPPLRRGLHRGAVRIIAPTSLSSCSDTLWTCASRWKAAGDNRWLHGRTDFELWPKSVIFQNHFMIGPNNLFNKLKLEEAYWSKVATFDGNWGWWVRVKIFCEGRVDQDGNELSWPASGLNCLNSGPSRPPVARNTYHWPHPRPLPRIWTR